MLPAATPRLNWDEDTGKVPVLTPSYPAAATYTDWKTRRVSLLQLCYVSAIVSLAHHEHWACSSMN